MDADTHRTQSVSQQADHSLVPPCQAACPLHMDIREYVDRVAQGRIMEALQVIRNGNPFPSICAYVCTRPCEDACRRQQVDMPIAIRALKRFAVEFGGDRMVQTEAATTRNERVAIIGSGPAGLACAYYLRKLGYPVTIFEAYSELGGMLRVGIPSYRLPREVLDTEVNRLTRMGVEIRTSTRIVTLDLVFELGYRAVFITIGAHQSLKMGIEGEDSPGVIDGATFLREVNLGLRPSLGDRVAVVGGGNVAIDAARTAARLGTRRVTVLYRRGREEMPADPAEVKLALEEGIRLKFRVTPVRVNREKGRLQVTCQKMKPGEPDASGRRRPEPVEGSDFRAGYDSLITAIGQAPHTPGEFRINIGRGSTIQVDPVTLTTNRAGVFAGGDAVTGPATVTQALSAGRLAAGRIDDYLQHRYPVALKEAENLAGDLLPETIEMIKKVERLEPPVLPPESRQSFQPEEQVYDWETAVSEARRCLRCGMGAEIVARDKCAACLTCLRVCPYHVPRVDGEGTVRIPEEQCLACGICVAECPAMAIALRKPYDRRSTGEELEHVLKAAQEAGIRPFVVGFGCQYGLFGTGTLSGLWRRAGAGVWIVPVLCVAKVETEHIFRGFEAGAEGIFIAGCGRQCARENTAVRLQQRAARVKKALGQLGLGPERLYIFDDGADPVAELDRFVARVSGLYLDSIIMQEVSR